MRKFTSKIKLVLILIILFAVLNIFVSPLFQLLGVNHDSLARVYFDIGTSLLEILLVFWAFSSGKKIILRYRKEKRHYLHLIEMFPEAIFVHRKGNFIFANKAGEALFGAKSNDDLFSHDWRGLIHFDAYNSEHFLKEEISSDQEQVLNYQIRANRLDGQVIDIEITSTNVEFDGMPAREIIARDISLRKQHEGLVKKLAYQDALTELPNRRAFMDQLEQQLITSEKTNSPFAVMFIDLDGFKNVNDSMGHEAGDRLLRTVGMSLKKCVRENDTVARIAGDEFTILLPGVKQQDCIPVAARILESLNLSFSIPEKEVRVSASIGISVYPENGKDAFTLIKHADMAMYHAKNNGKNRYQFTELVAAN